MKLKIFFLSVLIIISSSTESSGVKKTLMYQINKSDLAGYLPAGETEGFNQTLRMDSVGTDGSTFILIYQEQFEGIGLPPQDAYINIINKKGVITQSEKLPNKLQLTNAD